MNNPAKHRKLPVFFGIIAFLAIACMLTIDTFVYLAIRNPSTYASVKLVILRIGDSFYLEQELRTTYHAESVAIGITSDRILTISLTNSEINALSEDDQAAKAEEIALFVKNHFAGINGIIAIQVTFVQAIGLFSYPISIAKDYLFQDSKLK
jgi:hypothetical protein